MKSLKKRILKSHAAINSASWLLAQYIRLVFATSRKHYAIHPEAAAHMRGEDNALFAFWHGRILLMLPICPPRRRMWVLSSRHRDGSLTTRVIQRFGQDTIRGSSGKGGKAAMLNILRALKAGDNISITPDGPRGPHQLVGRGTATIARLARKPVIPVTFSARRAKHFTTWDHFVLAWPFNHIFLCVGAPVPIARDMDEEAARMSIEMAMNALVAQADGLARG